MRNKAIVQATSASGQSTNEKKEEPAFEPPPNERDYRYYPEGSAPNKPRKQRVW